MAFKFTKRIPLEFFGKEYGTSYFVMHIPSAKDAEDFGDMTVREAVQKYFVSGKIYQEGDKGLVDLNQADLPELPSEVLATVWERTVGNFQEGNSLDPKS